MAMLNKEGLEFWLRNLQIAVDFGILFSKVVGLASWCDDTALSCLFCRKLSCDT